MSEFTISAWRAWAPGLSDAVDWQRWRDGELNFADQAIPDISFLPAMQRRRLSALAKAAMATAHALLDGRDMPVLCCSVHGEAQRTYTLLQDVAAGEPLSPTAFGLSVHNAIVGQLSISLGIHSPALALAGGDFPLHSGFIEAAAMLAEGAPEMLLQFYEEPLPELYLHNTESPQRICATTLHLRASNNPGEGPREGEYRAELRYNPEANAAVSAFEWAEYQLPLITALVDGSGSLPLGQGWELLIGRNSDA
ncbi:beta-ketoacyl synthase chain length factor [Microbulbifer bruguierae]|uniref:Beta-ketoacyl synthase chain length factor n=1 Tax=Microbulbifer bruguierae TaxID=3029061 RepID=A0ABY8N8Q7_9GAMM|nr:beta-ketoacyl synthase chain length factor [Microbulbifer bruguierae]WGL15284.1 beta-ketoacyl synthase chain length factor [Microbulbifer bruguierae]